MNTDYEDEPDQPMQYFMKFSEAAIKVGDWLFKGKDLKDFPSRLADLVRLPLK